MEVLWQLWVTLQVSSCKVQTIIRGRYTFSMYYCSFHFTWHSMLMFSGWLFWYMHKTTSCFCALWILKHYPSERIILLHTCVSCASCQAREKLPIAQNGKLQLRWCLESPYCITVLFISLLSEVNRSGADMQVISCYCYPVVFHIAEQLNIFYSLLSSSILQVLRRNIVMEPWAACGRNLHKLCVNPHISIVNPLWTYIQAQPQTKTAQLWALHKGVWQLEFAHSLPPKSYNLCNLCKTHNRNHKCCTCMKKIANSHHISLLKNVV